MSGTSRLPSLGPRGEGWVVGQLVLIGLVAVLGVPGLGELPPRSAGRWAGLAVGLGLLAAGATVLVRAVGDLGPSLTAVPRPRDDAHLIETGIYGRIRHPIYGALILCAAGWAIATASLLALAASAALAIWLDAKARREEAWLLARYPGYAAYRRGTHRFVPGLY